MSERLFSANNYPGKIYKHSGFSSTILSSFSSPTTYVYGLTWDGTNTYSDDYALDKIYKHSGFSTTILSSFSSPSIDPQGLTWDGTNIYSDDNSSYKIYKHSGFSTTILSSFSSPSTFPLGLAWDGTNIYSDDANASKIYKHSGFSTTILSSFSSPSNYPTGLTWDGTNICSADNTLDKIYKHSGFSSTITSSFNSPTTAPAGLAWGAAVVSVSPSISPSVSPSPSPGTPIQVLKLNPTVDITRLIEVSSFKKEDNLTSEVDTCRFSIKKYGSRLSLPVLGDIIRVMNGGIKIFEGTIEKIVKNIRGGKIAIYQYECKDYTHSMDRKLVSKAYENQTPYQIIGDLRNTYFPTFTISNVANPSIMVEYVNFDYIQPSKALQQLAELLGYDWYVDYDKDIHFFSRTDGEAAPFSITDTNGYLVNKSLEIVEDTRQIKNTIYVRGGEYVGNSISDKVGVGDNVKKIFNLPYRYSVSPTVTVNAVNQTVGVDYLNSEDDYNCLWNYQEKIIKFKTAPGSGNVVTTGTPLIIVLIKASDNASAVKYGTYEFKIIDKTIITKEAARRRAQAEILDYAQSLQEARFLTYSSGLRSGMKININSAILNINESFIINKVSIKMLDHELFQYEISLVTTRTMGIIAYLQKQIADLDKKVGVFKQENTVIDTIKDLQGIDSVSISDSILDLDTSNNNIYSADSGTNLIYSHSGFSTTILSSFSSPSTAPRGLVWSRSYNNQGYNMSLFSADDPGKIYKHSGFSSTILSSFSSPSTNPYGPTWDGTNIYSTDATSAKIYKHSGFSSTILSSFSSPSTTPMGLTWDGTNIYSDDNVSEKIYKHSGFSSTILSSFSSPSVAPRGLVWDGVNICSCDMGAEKIYKHSGFSSTITSSFFSPFAYPTGLTWNGKATEWNF